MQRQYLGQGVCELIDDFKPSIAAEKPDIIICDFVSGFGAHIADELGIPCVIEAPAPLSILQVISRSMLPGDGRVSSWCGLMCQRENMVDLASDINLDYLVSAKFRDHFVAGKERIIICSSFFGLDPPMLKPPNMVLTGPLLRSDE